MSFWKVVHTLSRDCTPAYKRLAFNPENKTIRSLKEEDEKLETEYEFSVNTSEGILAVIILENPSKPLFHIVAKKMDHLLWNDIHCASVDSRYSFVLFDCAREEVIPCQEINDIIEPRVDWHLDRLKERSKETEAPSEYSPQFGNQKT